MAFAFIWLALLVVFAQFQIVIWRFVFSYEQAFMGDLVRFWYAALFLFASAYTLVEEGHVRVDVFYARFSARGKAWANLLGSLLLGAPLCWVIISLGMWSKAAVINMTRTWSRELGRHGIRVNAVAPGFVATEVIRAPNRVKLSVLKVEASKASGAACSILTLAWVTTGRLSSTMGSRPKASPLPGPSRPSPTLPRAITEYSMPLSSETLAL